MKRKWIVVTALGLFCFSQTLHAISIVDTFVEWNKTASNVDAYLIFNPGWVGTAGQTFIVGPDRILTKFTFLIKVRHGSTPYHFIVYLMKWGGDRPIGPILFESPEITVPPGGSDYTKKFNFYPAKNPLKAGSQYVIFLYTHYLMNGGDTTRDHIEIAGANGFYYAGGGMCATAGDGIDDLSTLNSKPWTFVGIADLAFRVQFASQ